MSGLLASAVLADEAQKSGPIGLATILVLCVACYFLLKSMSKHMRRVRERFPSDDKPAPRRPGQPPGADAPGTDTPAPAVDLGKHPPDSASR